MLAGGHVIYSVVVEVGVYVYVYEEGRMHVLQVHQQL